ncbi:hypothetical protein L198_07708 [Cryptococcus wingfieldii CBS 7118]|uniref:Uncharacterized protein n=1 Tax=Cryptococcus wingfieldii CBS 7118 TaxID=1295528 RepID=A0A1E3I3P1_9TREE|nr:hypothetical protein L198_07708 [Cryptococcus wingfieldii CBS 7118]ODN82486.1 hypothetical protein L198_07708 [Cryptococcus wingfieldii CBS 7118]
MFFNIFTKKTSSSTAKANNTQASNDAPTGQRDRPLDEDEELLRLRGGAKTRAAPPTTAPVMHIAAMAMPIMTLIRQQHTCRRAGVAYIAVEEE